MSVMLRGWAVERMVENVAAKVVLEKTRADGDVLLAWTAVRMAFAASWP